MGFTDIRGFGKCGEIGMPVEDIKFEAPLKGRHWSVRRYFL